VVTGDYWELDQHDWMLKCEVVN